MTQSAFDRPLTRGKPLSQPAKSMAAFAAYLGLCAVALLFLPNTACELLQLSRPDGLWVRVTAMLMLILAYYCYRTAREDERRFMYWSLKTRPLVLLFLSILVLAGQASARILLFGGIDALAALWTRTALRAQPTRKD